MSSQDLQTLEDMGFERDRALRALEITGHQGVEPAMEWLLAHAEESFSESQYTASINTSESAFALTGDRTESTVSGSESGETIESSRSEDSSKPSDDAADEASGPVRDEPHGPLPSTSAGGASTSAASSGASTSAASSGASTAVAPSGDPASAAPLADEAEEIGDQAKSLKCDECGKIFKSQVEIEYHAAKSNHSSFSESTEEKKPLTEEEKREQLKKLEEKMRAKRLEREEQEKKDAFEREKNRIRSGKEMIAARKKLEEQEMKKLVEQHKREKLEEKLARQRVKEQIEQDKLARKAKLAPGTTVMMETPSTLEMKKGPEGPHSSKPSRDYNQTKIQIRLTNGQCLTQTFGAKEQLSAVRLYVQMNRTDGDAPFLLMTNFPKKVFSDDDYEKPLDILGLVPSAVIILSKPSGKI